MEPGRGQGQEPGLVPDLLVVSPANEEMGRQILEAEFINGSSNVQRDSKTSGGAELASQETHGISSSHQEVIETHHLPGKKEDKAGQQDR